MVQEHCPEASDLTEFDPQMLRLLACLPVEVHCEIRALIIRRVLDSFEDDSEFREPITQLGGVDPRDLGDCDLEQERLAVWAWEEATGELFEYLCSPATPKEDEEAAATATRAFKIACWENFGASVDVKPDRVLRELQRMRSSLIQGLAKRAECRGSPA